MASADPGSGAAATGTLTVVDPPPLEDPPPELALFAAAAEADAEAMTCCGFTLAGLDPCERVCAAAFMTMSCWRSVSRAVTELLCVSAFSAPPKAPAELPLELIM